MRRYRLIALALAALAVAGLSCEMLESIQQDPSMVMNPDPNEEQQEATRQANLATLQVESDLAVTATAQSQSASQTALALTPTATKDSLRTFSTIEAETTATAAAEQTAAAAARLNLPPIITEFVANFIRDDRTTYYSVKAFDPDGDGSSQLKYEWSLTNECGDFTWDEADRLAPEAEWFHPHPPCPDERIHPATVTVIVTDALGGQASFAYTGGSASSLIATLTPFP